MAGGKDESSSLNHSSSGQKIERALAIKVEDVRPWGVGSKFSAAYADVSGPQPLLELFLWGNTLTWEFTVSVTHTHCLASTQRCAREAGFVLVWV